MYVCVIAYVYSKVRYVSNYPSRPTKSVYPRLSTINLPCSSALFFVIPHLLGIIIPHDFTVIRKDNYQ